MHDYQTQHTTVCFIGEVNAVEDIVAPVLFWYTLSGPTPHGTGWTGTVL